MKKNYLVFIMLIFAAALVFAGGGNQSATNSPYKNRITLDYFSTNGGGEGLLKGFTKQKINELFNMDINMIAPNISIREVFQTRAAAGFLGDIMALDNRFQRDVYESGLAMDLTALLKSKGSNITAKQSYIDLMNRTHNIPAGKTIFIPIAMSSFAPTEVLPNIDGGMNTLQEGASNYIRWDVYTAVGSPAINTLEDLLPVLKRMQDYAKTSDSGKPVYGMSFFGDWDDGVMRMATNLVEMYGYLMTPGTSTVFSWVGSDSLKTQRLDDEKGLYYRALKFFYNANRQGLVDPDSPTHTWDDLVTKTKDGQVLMSLWSWSGMSQYNNITRGNGNPPKGMEFIPIKDADYYIQTFNPASMWNQAMAVSSKAKDPDRVMDFINWTASPEGMQFSIFGPEGLAWEVKDGKIQPTEYGWKVLDNGAATPVPAQYGGGTWEDSIVLFGRGGWSFVYHWYETNPRTRVGYHPSTWPVVQESRTTQIDRIWRQQMGAQDEIDYLKKNNLYTPRIGTSYLPPVDSVQIQTARATCRTIVRTASWRMAFAASEAEFNSIWNTMKTDLRGAGFEDVVQVDLKLAADEVAARQQSLRNAR